MPPMPKVPLDRRTLLLGSAAAALVPAAVEAQHYGVRPGAPDDQATTLQRAIDEAAKTRKPLMLPAGVYRTGALRLPAGAQIFGVRGATRLVLTRGTSLLAAEGGEAITLAGLTLDGARVALLDITKRRGDEFLDRIEERLREHGAETFRVAKEIFSKPADPELIRRIANRGDLAVEGLAD